MNQLIQVTGYSRNAPFIAEKKATTFKLMKAPEVIAARIERSSREIDQWFANYLDAVLSAEDFSEVLK